jgi:hypothetical protein
MQQTNSNAMALKNAIILEVAEMEQISGGDCNGIAFACGAGVALSLFTGGLGALIFGPATGGLCYAAYKCK